MAVLTATPAPACATAFSLAIPSGASPTSASQEPSTRLRQLARRGRGFAFELSNRRLGCDRLETALDQLDKRLGEAETSLCGARRLCLSESGTLT